MASFSSGVDIANRGLQHAGARRISSFSDTSVNASEAAFLYDELRQAELRRSVWRFGTRRAVLRAVTASTSRFVPAAWNSGTAYTPGQLVIDTSGIWWISTFGSTNVTPGTVTVGSPAVWAQYFGPIVADQWDPTIQYYPGDVVLNGGTFYTNIAAGITTTGGGLPGSAWVSFGHGFAAPVTLAEPLGAGLTFNGKNRYAYHLPNGYLRLAGPDPKVESTATLATSGAIQFTDYQMEGNLLVSNNPGPIVPFRFVADVSDVTVMDPLFREGLAARLGYELCERLTQSNIKLQAIGAAYQKFMRDARMINQIETGSTEPEEEGLDLTQGPQNVQEGAQPQQAGA